MPAETIVYISENTSYQFTCTTSVGRPVPNIKWIVFEKTDEANYLIFEGYQTTPNKTSESEMLYANSTFLYMVNRTVNGWKIICSVEKTGIQTEVNSKAILLNITYPPVSRLMINGLFMESVYKVIENSTGSLNCTVEGGNPEPILSWSKCLGADQSSFKFKNDAFMETYSNVLKWKAIYNTDMKCTCFCTQKEQNQSLSINVDILYPPFPPSISFDNQVITEDISVIINTSLPLNCISDSRPASTYRWKFNDDYLSDSQQYVIQSNKADYGHYTCVATNVMEPTDGSEKIASNSKSFELHVLCA
ncbi:hemicentin-1-like [Ruditapes philippinarum]|uniref:hemicentin-1-like n=1 Tax=Ruditapes philippinarum TaxID=129788 RepID=UPI00295BB7D6|nr:hemicentin-1-like [Ruditapes philippinarum]